MMDVYIAGNNAASQITHIINGTGSAVICNPANGGWGGTAYANYLWLNPTNLYAGAGMSGLNVAVSFPSESWHGYQLQYKNALTDSGWSNLGGIVGGNDTLQTITDSASSSNRFYHIKAY